ncbi:MAG TPA: YihY/virulence factor BrkB family protein [Bacteroidales bacterium]|nr:YihY/virulence factor BrkB family protein [Bacteroidales bacterium]
MKNHSKLEAYFNKRLTRLIDKAEKISFPGFNDAALYDVIIFFYKGIQRGYLASRASAIAFNFALALFPTVIFLFTLIPYIPVNNLQTELLELIHDFLPQNAYRFLENTLVSVITQKNGSVLSIGAISSLIFSTSGVHALIDAFNNTYHSFDTRNWVGTRLVATLQVFILFLLIAVALLIIVFSQVILNMLVEYQVLEYNLTYYLIIAGKWIVATALFFFAISFLYYYAPAKKSQWHFISAGSSMATILIFLTSLGFSYFVNNFGQYNKLYGSIGTMMVILLWLYFNSFALILGFELNASINNAKTQKA